MSVEFYDGGAPLAEADLDAFEHRVQVRLPRQYRALLAKHNGGRVRPRKFRMQASSFSIGLIHYFVSIGPPMHVDFYWEMYKHPAQPRVPPEHIPIAECEGGDLLTLVIDGPKLGQIFYWDHEEEGAKAFTYDNLYFVAASLDELLAGLYDDKD